MIELTFNPGKRNPSVWLSTNINGVVLNPGVNELTNEQFNLIKSESIYKNYVSFGCIKLKEKIPKTIKSSKKSRKVIPIKEDLINEDIKE